MFQGKQAECMHVLYLLKQEYWVITMHEDICISDMLVSALVRFF